MESVEQSSVDAVRSVKPVDIFESDRATRDVVVAVGARVRELRQGLDLTQTDLAELCGCQRTAIVRLESRENPPANLALSTIVQIAYGLGVSVEVRLG